MSFALSPYDSYSDRSPGWPERMPTHWRQCRLKSTTTGCVTGVWGQEPAGGLTLSCVRVSDFDRWNLVVRTRPLTQREYRQEELRGKVLARSDILIEKSGGGDLQPVGAVVMWERAELAVTSNFIGRLPISGGHDPRYVTLLHSVLYQRGITRRSTNQTTGIQNLDIYSYLSESVPLPPVTEQAAIVRFIEHIDQRVNRLLRAKRRLIELLNEQKQAIIHKAVTRGLGPMVPLKPSGIDWLGDIPAHWAIRKLSQTFTTIGSGTTPATSNRHYYDDGDVPWVISGDLVNNELHGTCRSITRLALDHHSALKVFPVDSVVVAMYGATIGKVGLLRIPACVNQACCVLYGSIGVHPEYALNVFIALRQDIIRLAVGGGQPNISQAIIRQLKIPIPPVGEQRRILVELAVANRDLDLAISKATAGIVLIREYRTRLVSDVVTGQLDVRNVELPEFVEDVAADAQDAETDDLGQGDADNYEVAGE